MSDKCDDIIDLHAPLIHKAADVETQLNYKNGLLDAEIICLDGGKNVQKFLEKFLSLNGVPIVGEQPAGVKNNVNLIYTTADEFIPETLEVFLSGIKLNGDQTDPDRDYTITTVGANANKEFTIELNPANQHRLNQPPQQNEALYVNYGKRITFNTKGGT
jgi:hypothetical protein